MMVSWVCGSVRPFKISLFCDIKKSSKSSLFAKGAYFLMPGSESGFGDAWLKSSSPGDFYLLHLKLGDRD